MSVTLVITRPAPAGPPFAKAVLARLGQDVPVIHAPAFVIAPRAVDVPPLDHLILTSANGAAQAARLGIDRQTPVWAVGDKTAEAARANGFQAQSAGGNAEDLIKMIHIAAPVGRLLHLAGEHTRGDVAKRLSDMGYACNYVAAYAQDAQAPSSDLLAALAGTAPLVSPVFSPRSAAHFALPDRQAPLHAIAISATVSDVMIGYHADTVVTATTPDEPAMIDATCAVLVRLLDRG